jgi:hypothetical protein
MAADNIQQDTSQFTKVYTLSIPAGIKRDGTAFDNQEYVDGVWCRFQRGVPKKMGGYRSIFSSQVGIYRGMVSQPYDGVNYIFAGNYKELDVFTTGTTFATGSGPFPVTILPGTAFLSVANSNSTTFTVSGNTVSIFPATSKVIFSQSNAVTYTISGATYSSNANATTVTISSGTISGSPNTVYLANSVVFTSDQSNQTDPSVGVYFNLWQFDSQFSPLGGQLSVFAHPGKNLTNIDNGVVSQVLVGNITPSSNYSWSFSGLSDSLGQNPTYKPISVDGGVCVLYPFIFVYGSHGFIANNNVSGTYSQQNFYDWNGPLANQVNVGSSKIVKGMPMRGGTNSPAGLFWATDSLIRVTFNPAGSAASNVPGTYWNYDIVSSQISIMSSSAVVEMDGVYWWMGIDRFYLYNGQVQVVPNDKNVNWLFDNINYEQRQKVWATKVPRYNEIWFFYPRGTATECTDAIIYNTKDKIWYDAGQAVGAQRSCGYTTELFPNPIWADWNYIVNLGTATPTITHPASLAAPAANQFYLKGDQTAQFSPGDSITFSPSYSYNKTYTITSSVNIYNTTVLPPGVTLVTVSSNITPYPSIGQNAYYITGGFNLWQQEYGQNEISILGEVAVYSGFTTSNIDWISGSPGKTPTPLQASGTQLVGTNRRTHLRRIEPDFLQYGTMSMTILGSKFPAGGTANQEDSGPYFFDPDTGKIDLRVEHRLVRLKFESNALNGNYEMGRLIITAEFGDERP